MYGKAGFLENRVDHIRVEPLRDMRGFQEKLPVTVFQNLGDFFTVWRAMAILLGLNADTKGPSFLDLADCG